MWTERYCLVIGGWALLGARGLWELQIKQHRAKRDTILIAMIGLGRGPRRGLHRELFVA